MAAFLERNKVQRAGRISLGLAALRNLGISEGDFVEIYYDESSGALIIKRPSDDGSSTVAPMQKSRSKK